MDSPFVLDGAGIHLPADLPASVLALPDGRILTLEVEGSGVDRQVRLRLHDAAGRPLDGGTVVGPVIADANPEASKFADANPKATMLADGRVLVSWQQMHAVNGVPYQDLVSVMYDLRTQSGTALPVLPQSDDSPLGTGYVADGHEAQSWPDGTIAIATNGARMLDSRGWAIEIIYTVLRSDGSVLARGRANGSDEGFVYDPALTAVGSGFLAAWSGWSDYTMAGPDPDGNAIIGRVFSPTGVPLTGEMVLNADTQGPQRNVALASLPDGGAIAVWESSAAFEPTAAGVEIRSQRFDAQGQRVGGETTVHTTSAGDQTAPEVLVFGDGSCLVAWVHQSTFVDVRFFDAAGIGQGDVLRVGSTALGSVQGSNHPVGLVEMADGRVLVTWQTQAGGVDGQFIDRRSASLWGGAAGETLSGQDITNDVLVGFGGNDTLAGLGGNDHAYCGAGDDEARGSFGSDVLLGEAGNDSLHGDDGFDYLFGGEGSNLLSGGAGVDVLVSQGSNDTARGGEGADYVYAYGTGTTVAFGDGGDDIFVMQSGRAIAEGGAGRDYFYMGAGHDEMRGGDGLDVLIGQSGGSSTGVGDLFDGGAGMDYLFFTPGADQALLNAQSGLDVFYGFDVAGDTLVLDASLAGRMWSLTQYEGFTIADFGQGTAVWFMGLTAAQVQTVAVAVA